LCILIYCVYCVYIGILCILVYCVYCVYWYIVYIGILCILCVLVYCGCKLSFKIHYLRKDRRKNLRKDKEEEEVSSYWTTLRKGNDTRN
jgi:hypothetical protein